MREVEQDWNGSPSIVSMRNAWRRIDWFTSGSSLPQVVNGLSAVAHYGLRRQRLRSWPILVKVDISPVCNLHCTYCVHAESDLDPSGELALQRFSSRQRMPLERFETLVDEIHGKVATVALYYVGDPLTHPKLEQFCSIATAGGLNSHVSTNFSFRLSDDRLERLAKSGLTHLTVCVDSTDQEEYSRTRIGGDINLVKSNLERFLAIRAALKRQQPRVEVQYLRYQHNLDRLKAAASWCASLGVDQFTYYWGNLYNYADLSPRSVVTGDTLSDTAFPRCAWPWFAMQVKYDGDVLPCCYHRVSEQYRESGDARPVGNVFSSGLYDLWNSDEYQLIRRLSARPSSTSGREEVAHTFCFGCPVLFETKPARPVLTAETTRWEDVYFRKGTTKVARRP